MHADEGINADKFGTLLEGGGYAYDPSEYHGPTLYYLTLVPAWLQGARRYVDLDEATLRSVPAALGVGLVAAHLLARGSLGAGSAGAAALLASCSPAMVFYSRYFIHETPLVFFSFGALLAVCRYLQAPGAVPALVAGACAGLMLATKETAALALGSMVLGVGLTHAADRWREGGGHPLGGRGSGRHLLEALAAGGVVSSIFFSSFLTRPEGMVDAVRAYKLYLGRATAPSLHSHPWWYYLELLIHHPSSGTPFWTEGSILVLAVVGCAAGWVAGRVPGANARALRFLGFYTLLMLVAYSAIPYKTPWCLLGFLHGMILLAGAGVAFLVQVVQGRVSRLSLWVVLAATTSQLGWQAFEASFHLAADPRNPYVYAHTGTDVFEIVGRLKSLARVRSDGASTGIQIISRENLWPLPWYLRGLPRVEWWTGVSDAATSAPIILVTPDMEPALARKLYDLPPPGERELYASIFERPVELRPGVELRGYAASSVWEDYRRHEAEPNVPVPGVRE
jgi:uncharacterized protein (TIGR03663 family)